mmetsp:Transcript_1675/g.2395  ORF Transcript_1675/g.2395 Transcript_1675/m.2395 type:complete len:306 (+) Transcript_1675:149-1066(+)|eukprot:CAMPEP_0184868588 /NCGR_PEP_ID=MMETSP0580-20130426/30962_1 /TAXON_ID=1118495 /ORGANISM="Dactyliosolen fragilissimus" /LENGTH=305 /DNA_ID=CAMNT_0027369573 /DNA_START=36 /DNA_END=953 /DNA_ORIENTATION=-
MTEPDELYTLRAQYWLGHYKLAVEEAKSISRRPMSSSMKIEREEFLLRSLLALKQYERVIKDSSGNEKSAGIKALGLNAQYNATTSPESKAKVVVSLQKLLSDPSNSSSTTLSLIASHIFLAHGEMTREALQCVHLGATMEHLSVCVQIFLKMDRLDLARQKVDLMRQSDEESILAQLCTIQLNLANGRSQSDDAIHHLNSLSEQYGPSPMLQNYLAVAYMVSERYDIAESMLQDAENEEASSGVSADTLVNKIACLQQQGKGSLIDGVVDKLREGYPDHPFIKGLERFEVAFERESAKYKVGAN